jgi:multidrug efflux system membrane fusion protein
VGRTYISNIFKWGELSQLMKKYFLLSILLFALFACGKKADSDKPLPSAVVSHPLYRDVTDWDDYPARLQSPEVVNLTARISGVITSAPFHEGAVVTKGDLLFTIDDRPFQAEYGTKVANLKSAEAQQAQTDAHFKRVAKLKDTKAVSEQEYDLAEADLKRAVASVESARAAIDKSKLDLDWTHVLAPITGRISKKFITEGNQVTGGEANSTVLTTITSLDPIYTYATISENVFLKYRDLLKSAQAGEKGKMECSVKLENEKNFEHIGFVDFIDNQVDTSTGTIQMRCVLPNPDGNLTPGLYARLRIQASEQYKALLVPDTAVNSDQNSRYLLVLGKDNVIELRRVELGKLFGSLRAIQKGISAEDMVVITGLQQLRPGTKVTPNETQISDDPALAASTVSGTT